MPRDSALFVKAAAHGLDQKYGDEFAGLDDTEDCIEAFDALAARIAKGEWSEKRVSDGMAGTSLLVRALVEVSGGSKTVEQIKAVLADMDKETKQALSLQSEVAKVIARLKEERQAKKAKPAAEAAEAANAALAKLLG